MATKVSIINTTKCNYKCTEEFSADICAFCFFKYSEDTNNKRLNYCSRSGYFGGVNYYLDRNLKADEILLNIYYKFEGELWQTKKR